jgi:hypothetical protein
LKALNRRSRQLPGRLGGPRDRTISHPSLTLEAKIVPLAIDSQRRFDIWLSYYDIWLSYHSDNSGIPRIRRMIDWIIAAFNPTRFPWFKDEFIHPNDLKAVYKGESLINLFEGFSTEGR